jgi:hypothetical protein
MTVSAVESSGASMITEPVSCVHMVRTQIQLTEEQARELRELSAERGVSIAELIRRAVDTQLGTSHGASARRERALGVIGGFHSGRNDISTDHDRYVADAFEA